LALLDNPPSPVIALVRHEGVKEKRPIRDIYARILGEPDRDRLYAALSGVEERFGRPVQATIREAD
jgi:hypothetical protein